MNIKAKLTIGIGVLVAMIVLLVVLAVVNLQILTATDPGQSGCRSGVIPCIDLDFSGRRRLYRYRVYHAITLAFCY